MIYVFLVCATLNGTLACIPGLPTWMVGLNVFAATLNAMNFGIRLARATAPAQR